MPRETPLYGIIIQQVDCAVPYALDCSSTACQYSIALVLSLHDISSSYRNWSTRQSCANPATVR